MRTLRVSNSRPRNETRTGRIKVAGSILKSWEDFLDYFPKLLVFHTEYDYSGDIFVMTGFCAAFDVVPKHLPLDQIPFYDVVCSIINGKKVALIKRVA